MKTITDRTLTPLTREEMSTYMDFLKDTVATSTENWKKWCDNQNSAFTAAIERLEKVYSTRIDELTTVLKLLTQAQVNQNTSLESLRKSLFVINKAPQVEPNITNAKLTNSLSASDTAKWINNVWEACEKIGEKSGCSKVQVLKTVYKNLRNKHIDIDELYREYKRITGDQCAMIVTIGRSDYLRPLVEGEINEMYSKYFSKSTARKNNNVCKSVMARRNPESIDNLIKRYAAAKNIKSALSAKKDLYKRMRSIIGDCRAEKQLFERNNHVSECSFGYFVANTSMLLNLMTSIVEESENNGK